LDDPTGDTIYVITKDHSIYSNTLFEKEWVVAQANTSGEDAAIPSSFHTLAFFLVGRFRHPCPPQRRLVPCKGYNAHR